MNEPRPRTRVTAFARKEMTVERLQSELDAAKQTIAKLEEEKTAFRDMWKMAIDDWADGNKRTWEAFQVYKMEADKVLAWSQSAYTRLQALMTIGVSLTPDAVTKQLLADAPDSGERRAKP